MAGRSWKCWGTGWIGDGSERVWGKEPAGSLRLWHSAAMKQMELAWFTGELLICAAGLKAKHPSRWRGWALRGDKGCMHGHSTWRDCMVPVAMRFIGGSRRRWAGLWNPGTLPPLVTMARMRARLRIVPSIWEHLSRRGAGCRGKRWFSRNGGGIPGAASPGEAGSLPQAAMVCAFSAEDCGDLEPTSD